MHPPLENHLTFHFQIFFIVLFSSVAPQTITFASEAELEEFLHNEFERNASAICSKSAFANWAYNTDLNNQQVKDELLSVTLEIADITKAYWNVYFKNLNPDDYTKETLKREVKDLKILGDAALDADKLENLTNAVNSMVNIYSTAKICPYSKQSCNLSAEGLSLDPEIETVLKTSTDYNELLYVWTAWRNASGAKMKDLYKTYVQISNDAAYANGFSDKGAMWRYSFDSDTFIQDMDALWLQMEPLYTELHTYAKNKLKDRYGEEIDVSDGLIPAHVFGNMWAQNWGMLEDLLKPYPDASEVDVTAELVKQGYTPLKMFQTSDEFYQSMGLKPNGISYNVSAGAMIEKPTDGREVLCHASAWDFCDGVNYRIKMCTGVNYEDFVTIHHEMGHIQYYLQYKDQPITFRGGANPGFHEAVGDTIALSVANPQHLQKIGLLDGYEDSDEASLNALMEMALGRVAFLPFGLLIDKWRWDVFSGNVTEDKWNSHWWHYRETLQKVKAPIERSDEDDFDPGAKFHVAGDSQYISYFVAHILEFQLYRSLCIAAGQYDPETKSVPLHKCDFYNSTKAGSLLASGLSLGASKHWSETLEVMTGSKELSAEAILEYFDPLYQYLKQQNEAASSNKGNTVAIVVGSIVGVIVVAGLGYYGYRKWKSWVFDVPMHGLESFGQAVATFRVVGR